MAVTVCGPLAGAEWALVALLGTGGVLLEAGVRPASVRPVLRTSGYFGLSPSSPVRSCWSS